MPTYEYRCDACGHTFEQFQSIKADPTKKCPKCAKNKVHRLIGTGAGLIFKGSGFYITDHRDKAYTDKAKAEGAAASGEKAGEKSDKPATTAASDTGTAKPADTKTSTSSPAPAKTDSKPARKSK